MWLFRDKYYFFIIEKRFLRTDEKVSRSWFGPRAVVWHSWSTPYIIKPKKLRMRLLYSNVGGGGWNKRKGGESLPVRHPQRRYMIVKPVPFFLLAIRSFPAVGRAAASSPATNRNTVFSGPEREDDQRFRCQHPVCLSSAKTTVSSALPITLPLM